MIDVPVYNIEGEQVDTMRVDPEALGGTPNRALLKQAVVMYQANRRQGSATTRSRGMVQGSTVKIYRQKGTGRARAGAARTPLRRGGGVTFAKRPKSWRQALPKKARRAARQSALLAKLLDDQVLVLNELKLAAPKTREMARILSVLRVERGCTLAIRDDDGNVLKSARNIPKVDVRDVGDLNAYDILLRRKLLVTREAMTTLLGEALSATAGSTATRDDASVGGDGPEAAAVASGPEPVTGTDASQTVDSPNVDEGEE